MDKKRIFLIFFFTIVLVSAAAAQVSELFLTSDRCVACHNGLVTPEGEDISFGTNWRASMMANSSRDPYWQAAVRRETLEHPSVGAAIQHECAACHMPMSRYLAKVSGGMGTVFGNLPIIRQATAAARLAADGVSCSMCHQIQKDKLGTKESFTAGFVVDPDTAMGRRDIFGPYDVDEGRKILMQSSAQFIPQRSPHIQSSELCASCHTLFTHAFDENGVVIGEFPEQVPYLEWKHSDYYQERNCQSCHMPEVDGKTPITSVVGHEREEVSRHVFRGGNFFIPKILNRHRDELGVSAQPQELTTASRKTVEHLQSAAANIELQDAEIREGRLHAQIFIDNLAGHKLPSAYPSRRAWIHFVVHDANNNLVFESGRLNPDGSIQGNDNDADKERFEPHYDEIDAPEEVQIYESILGGPDTKVTTVLLSAVRYLKDNRLLPDGFDKATAEKDIAVNGSAATDSDFIGGGDTIRFTVPLEGRPGPFSVTVELWYQPVGYRWAQNLKQQSAEEIERFVSYYNNLSKTSGTVLASDSAEVTREGQK
jgi:cytochrome c551/c552